MTHLTEEQLILYYYGEPVETAQVETHLDTCEQCRASYTALQRVLNTVDSLPVPERGGSYGQEVWARLAPSLGSRRRALAWLPFPRRWVAVAGLAVLVMGAFLAGRLSQRGPVPPAVAKSGAPGQVRERVLLVAVGDHLERSQMVLVELMNADAKGGLDISGEQQRAEDLIDSNRLYRQTAARTGDTRVAALLDELERVLLEIARGPSRLTPDELESIRHRIDADGILFKVRVTGARVRQGEAAAGVDPHRKSL